MPSNNISTPKWYRTLATLVDNVGTTAFPDQLAKTCQHVSPYSSTLITAFPKGQRPVFVFHNLSQEHAKATAGPYFSGAYMLDPFYALYEADAPCGVYSLKDVAPDKFYDSDYFHTYYEDTDLQDEAGLLIKINDALHILISLGARDTDPTSKLGQFAKLQTITPLLISICQQHWSKAHAIMPMRATGRDDTFSAPLDKAFKNFGKDFLSSRECEVVQLILKGHSSKSIARLLDISTDTVKVHRKRFHVKLDISSLAELFSLFLEAIALVPLGSEEDPLSFYFNGARTKAQPL